MSSQSAVVPGLNNVDPHGISVFFPKLKLRKKRVAMVLLDVQLTLKSWLDSDTPVKKKNLNNPQLETNETCCCDLCSSEHFFAGRPFFVKSAFFDDLKATKQ